MARQIVLDTETTGLSAEGAGMQCATRTNRAPWLQTDRHTLSEVHAKNQVKSASSLCTASAYSYQKYSI